MQEDSIHVNYSGEISSELCEDEHGQDLRQYTEFENTGIDIHEGNHQENHQGEQLDKEETPTCEIAEKETECLKAKHATEIKVIGSRLSLTTSDIG